MQQKFVMEALEEDLARFDATLTRKDLIRYAVGGMATLGAGAAVAGLAGRASAAATAETLRIMGPDVSQLDNWDHFEKATGMKIRWTAIQDLSGVFIEKVVRGGAADSNDLLVMDGGPQSILGPRGYMLPVDTRRIRGWSKIPAGVRNSPLVTLNGKPFGIPATFNADSFGYYPKDLGRPTSWKVVFDDTRTLRKVALEDNAITTFPMAAMYLAWHGKAKIKDPSNMTASEARTVADFLISRKKAGQFRALWTSWEESLNMLGTREVIVSNVWEPAIRELQAKGKKVEYALPKEGYGKWIFGWYLPRRAKDAEVADRAYRALNWFLGGDYGAHVAALRGYATPRMDLAAAYVRTHPREFSKADAAYVLNKATQVQRKFRSKYFWEVVSPTNRDVIEAEWERFKQA